MSLDDASRSLFTRQITSDTIWQVSWLVYQHQSRLPNITQWLNDFNSSHTVAGTALAYYYLPNSHFKLEHLLKAPIQ